MKGVGKSIIFPDIPARALLHGAGVFMVLWSRRSTGSEGFCRRSHTEPGESPHPTGEGKESRNCPKKIAKMGFKVQQTPHWSQWLRVKPRVVQPEPELLHKGMGSSPAWAGWRK